MGIFPGFGSWINQNTQQPSNAESREFRNGESQFNTHEEKDEMMEQLKLWRDAEKKNNKWRNTPAKVKVETRNDLQRGMCHMHMEFTIGLPPQAAYDVLTNPDNQPYFRIIKERLCKHMVPKSQEEYKKSSRGQGNIASKVKMKQIFKPSSLLNFPALSCYVRKITIKTIKDLVEDLQDRGSIIRGV